MRFNGGIAVSVDGRRKVSGIVVLGLGHIEIFIFFFDAFNTVSAEAASDAAKQVHCSDDSEGCSVSPNLTVFAEDTWSAFVGVVNFLEVLSEIGVVTGLHQHYNEEEVDSDTSGKSTEVAAAFAERLATSHSHFYLF